MQNRLFEDMLVLLVLTGLLWLALAIHARGAPAPVAKPRPVPVPCGSYLVTGGALPWSGWTLTFRPDGTFADSQGGSVWKGHWQFEKGRLYFNEFAGGSKFYAEAAVLPDGLTGVYGSDDLPPTTPLRITWRKVK